MQEAVRRHPTSRKLCKKSRWDSQREEKGEFSLTQKGYRWEQPVLPIPTSHSGLGIPGNFCGTSAEERVWFLSAVQSQAVEFTRPHLQKASKPPILTSVNGAARYPPMDLSMKITPPCRLERGFGV